MPSKAIAFILILIIAALCTSCGSRKRSDEFLKQGISLQRQGQTSQALESFKRAIRLNRHNIPAHQGYQDILCRQGKKEEILQEYGALAEKYKRSAECQYLYGRLLPRGEARKRFERAVELDQGFAWGYYGIGLCQKEEKKWVEAASSFRKSTEMDSGIVEFHLEIGRCYAILGRWNEAENEFLRVVQIDPEWVMGYYYLGQAMLALGNVDDALAQCQTALKLDPGNREVTLLAGVANLRKGEFEKAGGSFRKVMKQNPDDIWALINMGRLLALEGKWGKAIKLYQKAIRINEDIPEAYFYLALAYAGEKKWDQALLELGRASQIDGIFPGVKKISALILAAKGEDQGVLRELAAEEKVVGTDAEVEFIRGLLLLRAPYVSKTNANKAEEYFKRALEVNSRYIPAYLGLAEVNEFYWEFKQAIRVYEQILSFLPGDAEIKYRIGRCYSLMGDEKMAYKFLKESLDGGMNDWVRINSDNAIIGLRYLPEVDRLLKERQMKKGQPNPLYRHRALKDARDFLSARIYELNRGL